jgi:hypothetical protein
MKVFGRLPTFRTSFPIHEPDALLEGRRTLAQEPRLADAQLGQSRADGGKRALADTDGGDVRRLDQDDLRAIGTVGAQALGQVGGGQPPGGAPADDDDAIAGHAHDSVDDDGKKKPG